jgi:hypothetical protein
MKNAFKLDTSDDSTVEDEHGRATELFNVLMQSCIELCKKEDEYSDGSIAAQFWPPSLREWSGKSADAEFGRKQIAAIERQQRIEKLKSEIAKLEAENVHNIQTFAKENQQAVSKSFFVIDISRKPISRTYGSYDSEELMFEREDARAKTIREALALIPDAIEGVIRPTFRSNSWHGMADQIIKQTLKPLERGYVKQSIYAESKKIAWQIVDILSIQNIPAEVRTVTALDPDVIRMP